MKFINPKVELIDETDVFKRIELAGRTCYKSEDKITDDSAYPFVGRLVNREHLAMLEHSFLRFCHLFDSENFEHAHVLYDTVRALNNEFIHITHTYTKDNKIRVIISANLRALHESHIVSVNIQKESDKIVGSNLVYHTTFLNKDYQISDSEFESIEDLTEEEIDNHRYITMRFTCDRGVSHELVRHRLFSFAQESTRYVKYNNGDMEFIYPADYNGWDTETQRIFTHSLSCCEHNYKELMRLGLVAQQARAVLPNAIKTEVVVTGNQKEWKHFFGLRCDPAAHPDMQVVANMSKTIYYNYLISQGYKAD